jgi:hypothetical protein
VSEKDIGTLFQNGDEGNIIDLEASSSGEDEY